MIGKYLIGLYIGRASVGSAFGAAGSLAVVLVWIYYSAQIVLLGAEFTRVYANRFGAKVRPSSAGGSRAERRRTPAGPGRAARRRPERASAHGRRSGFPPAPSRTPR